MSLEKVYDLNGEFSKSNVCGNERVAAKRVDIVSVRLVKEASLMYKRRFVGSPDHAYEIFKEFLEDLDREIFVVLSLNTKSQSVSINTAPLTVFVVWYDICSNIM